MSSSSNEKPGIGSRLCITGLAVFFAAFLFYPLLYVFRKAFIVDGAFSLEFFRLLLENETLRESLGNSLAIACWVTLLASAAGFAFAALVVKTDLPLKGPIGNLLLMPVILPPFVGAIGVKYIFGRFGMVNLLLIRLGMADRLNPVDWLGQPFWGVVLLEALHLFPIMYLNIVGSYAMIDPTLEEAAQGLGARGSTLFRTVTMPLLAPGFFAGASIVFIWAFTDLGTPLLFEYRTVAPVQIFNNVQAVQENLLGYALVVVVLGITALFFVSAKFLFGRRRYEMPAFGRTSGALVRLPRPVKAAALAFSGAFILLAVTPHISVLMVSLSKDWFMTVLPAEWTLEYYGKSFTHPAAFTSIRNSLAYSGLAMAAVLGLGGTTAYILARKKFRGREALDACAMLPLAAPGVVLAFGYVQGFFGTGLDPRVNPVPLLVISYAVRRLPLVVRALYAGFMQSSVTLEEASASLGAGPAATMKNITLPIIKANLLGAAILAFAFSMLEVSDSLILAMQERFYPMTKEIYMLMGRLGDGGYIASAMGVLGLVILAGALALAQKLIGKRLGDLFRA